MIKPVGSLGRLESLPPRWAALQGTDRPQARPAAAILFAADHPVVQRGVSAYPAAVTAAIVRSLHAGQAAAAVLARSTGTPLHVVDVGVNTASFTPTASGITATRAEVASDREGDVTVADAMSRRTYARAFAAGVQAVDALAADVRTVVLGEVGIGNTTLAACIAAKYTGMAPDRAVGRGAG
ncbi:MAG: nicotinate-nucleotide--dimethylbenzimidazole phosphoribosyltransferase, partial [Myxococcota bacterium]